MKKQQGFTLIELVVVIIILGILAVTAAPKFINLQSDARESALQGLKGAIQGANSLLYSKAALAGKESKATETIDIAGTSATTDDVAIVYGYMAPTLAAFEAGMDIKLDAGSSPTAAGTDEWVFLAGTPANGATIWQRGAPADVASPAAACKLEYVQAAQGGTPTITVTTTGC
ncbi:type II secretion system GspH family protein [Shewanella sp. 3B26]|jgi:MSHA pilin protein MshA|uniref:Type II secretion system GspH family protein n=1 Tax=Shewanella zhuhaiensis TaxID=2919576 RepID=A0AAJ1F930_9GAMM|nr:type II secretion system protein [Shewanella zhuhaiensis]MCH4292805.1 type II secretion system GspH family protein [Shewanella zhuhaiensis]